MKQFITSIFICTLVLGACSSSEEQAESTTFQVEKPVVSEISYNSAKVRVNILNVSSAIKEKGVCYSLHSNPNTLGETVKSQDDSKSFSVMLEGLSVNKLYYIRAYVITQEHGLVYSDTETFTTLDSNMPAEL